MARVFSVKCYRYCTLIVAAIVAGCENEPCIDCPYPGPGFTVTVTGETGTPIAGAAITGGVDWTFFHVVTDSSGEATLPGSARGGGTISATNHFPLLVERFAPGDYRLRSTPATVRRLGDARGEVIRFAGGLLLTVEYSGLYHAYGYDDAGVVELAAAQLQPDVRRVRTVGDRLWIGTVDAGIRAYSLQDPLAPVLEFTLPVDGDAGAFAVRGDVLAVGPGAGVGPLRIFTYDASGALVPAAALRNYVIEEMEFLDQYLVLIGNSSVMPVVFDLSDPLRPVLVYNGIEPGITTAFLYKRRLVLGPRTGLRYTLLSLFLPWDPEVQVEFSADSRVTAVIDDVTAAGRSALDGLSVTIMGGSISRSVETRAVIRAPGCCGFEAADLPYVKVDDGVWGISE